MIQPRYARLSWAMAIGVTAAFGYLGWLRRWTGDDGFINKRIVENLLMGHGPVFNAGERVEAATSTAWLLVLTLGRAAGARVELVGLYAGIVFSVAAFLLAFAAVHAQRRQGPAEGFLVPLGLVVYASVAVSWDYVTSGLENSLSLLWLAATYRVLVALPAPRDRRARVDIACAVLVGLAPLVRPELSLFGIGAGAALVVDAYRRGGLRRSLASVTCAGTIPVAVQIFRMGYYGVLTPHTAIAKSAFGSDWPQGFWFVSNFFGLYLLPIPLALLALLFVLGRRRARRAVDPRAGATLLAPAIAWSSAALYILSIVHNGGGFMHGRLWLPAFFLLLLPVAALPVSCRYLGGEILLTLLIASWAGYSGTSIRVDRYNEHGIGDERGWYAEQAGVENPVLLEDYAKMRFYRDGEEMRTRAARGCPTADGGSTRRFVIFSRRESFGALHVECVPLRHRDGPPLMVTQYGALGLAPLAAGHGVHVIDARGLSDPIAGRMTVQRNRRPGHNRYMHHEWRIARFGDPDRDFGGRVQMARVALSCAELSDLLDSVEAPLTPARFWANIRGAYARQTLQIPPNTSQAMMRFCGL